MPIKMLIRGARIVDPGLGLDMVADVLIEDGKIATIGEIPDQHGFGLTVLKAQGLILAPGFIDLHCHLREPGFEDKETIATGTKSAACGGFTTICCMPNTNPPLDTASAVNDVRSRAAEGPVRVLPIGCITRNRGGEYIADMVELASAGVVGFSDDGNPVSNSRIMCRALEYSSNLSVPVIEHCEDTILSEGGVMNEGWVAIRLGLKGIPSAAEEIAVARDLALCKATGGRLHITHVSTGASVDLIRRAKDKGLNVSADVTPHHLTLSEERVMGGDNGNCQRSALLDSYDTNAKVDPPLRTLEDIEVLIDGISSGIIDAIATDHAPHTLSDKMRDFSAAPFGISGFETAFAVLMTLVHSGKLSLYTLLSKLTAAPAAIVGDRFGKLGSLAPGTPADIALLDINKEWEVDGLQFSSKGRNSPFLGNTLRGAVVATISNGRLVHYDKTIEVETL